MPDFKLQLTGLANAPWLVISMETGAVSGLSEILSDENLGREAGRLFQVLGPMGERFEEAGNYTAAVAVYEAVGQIAAALGDRVSQGASLTNIGLAYKRARRYDDAQLRYEEALAVLKEPLPSSQLEAHRPLQLAMLLLNMANLCYERGDTAQVRGYATWAVRIVAGNPHPVARSVAAGCDKLLAAI